jgi:AAA domain, putative AbiEii toxin, Type IV TA system
LSKSGRVLEELTISRFKSIRELTLQVGRVNLFIGGNGTGKSNILEAIGLTSACLDRGLGDSDIGMKGLRLTPPTLMKSSFKNAELPKTLELEAKFTGSVSYKAILQSSDNNPLLRFFSESSKLRERDVFGRSGAGARAMGLKHPERLSNNRGIWDQIRAVNEHIPSEVGDAFAEFSRFVIYSPQTDFLRGRQVGRVDNPPIGLHGEGLPEAVSTFLDVLGSHREKNRRREGKSQLNGDIIRSCADLVWLPGWASQFGSHRGKSNLTSRDVADRASRSVYFIDKFMHASRNQLSVYDSSEGTLFLLFAAIILSHPEAPRIFALDNVDSGLNPKLTRALVEQIIKTTQLSKSGEATLGARQVFLTSHNPTALDAFDIFDQEQRVFVVSRNERGHTGAERLLPPNGMTREDWQIAKNGRNLSQVWLDGDIPGAMGL